MEAVGSVASIIAVLTLALQSTKVIYEFTSSISHASDDIARLTAATGNLQKLLGATKLLAEHAKRTHSVAGGTLLEKAQPLVDQCANDLGKISGKLSHLQKDSKDGRWKKAQKHAKIYLDTRGVTEIWSTVNHYVELLGSCLGNASVDVGLYNAQDLRLLRDEVSAASQADRSQLSHVEDVLRDQRALAQASFDALQVEVQQGSLEAREATASQIHGIGEIITRQQQFERAAAIRHQEIAGVPTDVLRLRAVMNYESQRATIRSEALLTEVRKGFSNATTALSKQVQENRLMDTAVTQELQGISDRLQALPNVGRDQLSKIQGLVQGVTETLGHMQLKMRTGQKSPTSMTAEAYLTEDDRPTGLQMSPDSEPNKIMARVCNYAGKITACRYSQDSQSVIEDLGRLFGLVMQQISATSPRLDELPRKRKTLCDYDYSKLETAALSMENLRKAKRALTSSDRVRTLNIEYIDKGEFSSILFSNHYTKSLPTNARRRRVTSVNLQTIARSWTLGNYRLDAIFSTVILPDAEDLDTESADESFAAKLLITPVSAPKSNFQIVIDVASKTYHDRTIYLTPVLTFRAIVPDDSEVFRVVEGGSVRKLKNLLNNGMASLGDCDSMGRSLLNFAIYKCRRAMINFLIQSGADVDTLEPRHPEDSKWNGSWGPTKPLDMFPRMNDSELHCEDLERVERCYKLLLDAGSYIGSINYYGYASAFHVALSVGTLAKLKALIELGKPFISLESTSDSFPRKKAPLLLLASDHSKGLDSNLQMPDKVGLLLTRGANVKTRNSHGETCLHLILEEHHHRGRYCWCHDGHILWRHQCRTKDIVILMITAGADVCAVDWKGKSVSDVAVRSGHQTLWTEALRYCGIDVKDVSAKTKADAARSTALSPEYSQPPKSVRSKMSLEEYMERRKAFRVPEERDLERMNPELDSSEDDESENEDLKSRESHFEDDKNEDEDWTEGPSEESEIDEQVSDDEDDGTPLQYGEDNTKGKTKLD